MAFSILFAVCIPYVSSSQRTDSILPRNAVTSLSKQINAEMHRLTKRMQRNLDHSLRSSYKEERKIWQSLLKGPDSALAGIKLAELEDFYLSLGTRIWNPISSGKKKYYQSRLDSLENLLHFLSVSASLEDVENATTNTIRLGSLFSEAEDIQLVIGKRQDFLYQILRQRGLTRKLKVLHKQAYYYQAQLEEYRRILKNPRKLEQQVLALLRKNKAFLEFFRKNSVLATLFPSPGTGVSGTSGLVGLQTRSGVNALIQSQGRGGLQQIQQNALAARSQLQSIRSRLNGLMPGSEGSASEMPDFKRNGQKVKTVWQRLEYGLNLQANKARYYFPNTTDLAVSLGYKLNDRSVVGIGFAYKLGMGTGWRQVKLSHQGLGLRSFIDWKLKGNLWISGGFERNYQPIDSLGEDWQSSGMIGLSKKHKIGKKREGKMMLLWDFLSYWQIPNSRQIVFRVQYNL